MEISHEQYVSTFNSLPLVIRSFIVDGSIAPIIQDIGKTYSLHVDVLGELDEQATYMLMGLISPAEVLGKLVLADVPSDAAKAILQELNTRVFTPLQKRMRENPSGESEDATETTGPAEMPQPQEPPAPSPATPAAESRSGTAPAEPRVPVMAIDIKEAVPPNLPGQYAVPQPPAPPAYTPPVPIPVATPTPPPYVAPIPVYQAPAPVPAIPIYSEQSPTQRGPQPVAPAAAPVQPHPPVARTMESDMELATQGFRPGSGEQMASSFVPMPAAYTPAPAPTFTAPPPAPAPAPQPQVPAPSIPPHVPAASSYPPPAMASVRLTPIDRTHSNAPITKEYGSDPYRESIE